MEKIGVISGIYIAPGPGEKMIPLGEAQITETGVEGDRYETHLGWWQDKDDRLTDPSKKKIRDISIQF